MAAYRVVFTPRAETQLNGLYDYIAEHGGAARAEKYLGAIVTACRALAIAPRRGTQHDEIRPGLRTVGYKRRVTIAFSVENAVVVIHGIFYGGRDFKRILSSEDGDL